MAITKLNSPLLVNGQPAYPKTSADQVTFKDCPPSSLQDMFNLIYPVGSVYMSINSTDPTNLFGGTWEQIKGRFLVGVGPLDDNTTDYWGALTEKYNMPAGEKGGQTKHKHGLNDNAAALIGNHGDTTAFSPNYNFYIGTSYNINNGAYCWSHTHDNPFNSDNSKFSLLAAVGLVGNTVSANNMPPYLAVYMWKRTA